MTSAHTKAEEYLKNASYFHLGSLPTEASHHQTRELSNLANNDPSQAIELLHQVDVAALKKLESYLPELAPLTIAINETLGSGGRIFICGCGATGRLSLSLEYLWRKQQPKLIPALSESVIGFMAGGDVALVHSIEGFEDFTEYGSEHLISLEFSENDLLIASTEGGETSFVIGATEKAANISKRKPFFLYCNPRDILIKHVERSRRVLQNPNINSICLEIGPMALSGSTRMQASTVLMLAIGISLLGHTASDLTNFIKFFEDSKTKEDIKKIESFIKLESDIYLKKNRILYSAEDLAITVFTDTTERSPTFSLPPFGNKTQSTEDQSIAYLMIPSSEDINQSWHKLLARPPRVLEWPQRNTKTTLEYLQGFDFSKHTLTYRQKIIPSAQHYIFSIEHSGASIDWKLEELELSLIISGAGNLFDHIYLKMLLNIHSTLIMARLGRSVLNFMTYVSPTNGKLIDRSARYTLWLLNQNNIFSISYEQVVRELFRQLESLRPGESVVLKTFEALKI